MMVAVSGWNLILFTCIGLILGVILAMRKNRMIFPWREKGMSSSMPRHVPENPYDISKLDLQYPYLTDNSPRSCPVRMDEIMDYLAVEAVGGEELTEADLEFVRTAKVGRSKFWLWRFFEPDGDEGYVTVEDRGSISTGFNRSDVTGYDEAQRPARLNPEEFIFAMYHHVF